LRTLTTSDQEKKECGSWPGDGIFKRFLADAVAAQETADREGDALAAPIGKKAQESLLIPNQNYRTGKP
jgi:hypothetical protein